MKSAFVKSAFVKSAFVKSACVKSADAPAAERGDEEELHKLLRLGHVSPLAAERVEHRDDVVFAELVHEREVGAQAGHTEQQRQAHRAVRVSQLREAAAEGGGRERRVAQQPAARHAMRRGR